MKILALELSSHRRSVAVLDTDSGARGCAEEAGGRAVIALVERALREAKAEREEIGLVAVGLGPGSYTGIRGAVALAQGWQLGRGTSTIGISSVECLAAQAQAEGWFGRVNIVIDAQRKEFYLAPFEITAVSLKTLEPLRLAAAVEIAALEGDGLLAGPDAPSSFKFAHDLHPHAATLARLAAARTDFVTADKLEPIYLRAVAFLKAPPRRVVS